MIGGRSGVSGNGAIRMTAEIRTDEMARLLEQTRAETLRLFALVPDEGDLRRPPSPGFRPIMWHRGHIGAYEAYWILQKSKGAPSPSADFEQIFDPIKTPREDSSSLPPLDEIDAYVGSIRASALDYLRSPEGRLDWETYHLVLEHELQHQETMLQTLQLSGVCEAVVAGSVRAEQIALHEAMGVAAEEVKRGLSAAVLVA